MDEHGQIEEGHSISAGLDYPGIGPEHAWLKDIGRVTYRRLHRRGGARRLPSLRQARGHHPRAGAGPRARPRLRRGAGPPARPPHGGEHLRSRRQGPGAGGGAPLGGEAGRDDVSLRLVLRGGGAEGEPGTHCALVSWSSRKRDGVRIFATLRPNDNLFWPLFAAACWRRASCPIRNLLVAIDAGGTITSFRLP